MPAMAFNRRGRAGLIVVRSLAQSIAVHTGRDIERGTFSGLDLDGALLLKTDTGALRRIGFGDVEVVRPPAGPTARKVTSSSAMAKNPRQDRPQELVFTALGGLGEIGMNLYLYGLGRNGDYDWLMVDLGITFPGGGEPGVDVILPDIRYIEERRKNLKGIVLTHGHEDHIGAVIELWPRLKAPIYATPFTAALLKAKLAEESSDLKLPINILPMEAKFTIGGFELEFVTVAHSIPEPSALVIRAAGGIVVHTADWKIDRNPITGKPTNEARLANSEPPASMS